MQVAARCGSVWPQAKVPVRGTLPLQIRSTLQLRTQASSEIVIPLDRGYHTCSLLRTYVCRDSEHETDENENEKEYDEPATAGGAWRRSSLSS